MCCSPEPKTILQCWAQKKTLLFYSFLCFSKCCLFIWGLMVIAYSPTFGTSNLDQCGHTCTDVDKKQMCTKSIAHRRTTSHK